MRSSVNISNSLAVIKVLVKRAGKFCFFKRKKHKKSLFRLDRMAQSRGGLKAQD